MPRNYAVYLQDMLESIARIERYVSGFTRDTLDKEEMRKDAVIRNLMVIGEAAKNIPKDMRAKAPDVEWNDISGLRDVLVHQYFETDLSIVWEIITEDLPALKRGVKMLLESVGSGK